MTIETTATAATTATSAAVATPTPETATPVPSALAELKAQLASKLRGEEEIEAPAASEEASAPEQGEKPATPEPPAPDKPAEPEKKSEDELVSERVELAARKGKLAQRERAIEAREKAIAEREREVSELKQLWETDPHALLSKLKIDPYEWAQKASKSPEQLRLEKLEADLRDEREKRAKEDEARQAEAAKRQDLGVIAGVVRGGLESCPTLAEYLKDGDLSESELVEALYTDALDAFRESGSAPDIRALLKTYEGHFAKRLERELARAARRAPKPAPPAASAAGVKGAKPKSPTPTLTNVDAATKTGEQPTTLAEFQAQLAARLRGDAA